MSTTVQDLLDLVAGRAPSSVIPDDEIDDCFPSLRPGHGEIYVTTPVATSFSDNSTFVDAAGTWSASGLESHWDMETNGQLRYTHTEPRMVHIAASLSMVSNSNNQVIHVAVAKNGTVLTPSRLERKIGTGTDVGSTALHAFTSVVTNDYLTIQMYDEDWTAAQTVTLQRANLFAMDMG